MRIFDVDHSAAKHFQHGTHRTRSPRATLDAFVPRMREFGITRLADVTGLDHIGIPVYMAVRPNARSLAVAQGKGIDHDSAKASALMEAIESWHAENIEAPLRYESFARLHRSARVIDVTRLPVRRGGALEPNSPCLWIEGYDLIRGESTWVPFESVMTNFVRPERAMTAFVTGSNGLASGNHLLEAVEHALCEVIERDACTVWNSRGGRSLVDTRVDLDTVTDPAVRRVLERLAGAGFVVGAWEVTSDTGIPAYDALILEDPDQPRWALKGTFGGHGCHLDPGVALLRAVTEAVQSRLTLIAGSRDDMYEYATEANPDDLRIIMDLVTGSPGGRAFPSGRSQATDTFEGDIAVLLAALRGIGVENAVVVDLTRPDIGVPVVKVVVPVLEPDDAHFDYLPGPRARAAAVTRT
ncbi:YcaO-like family protein [Actinokineospora auranticolor]|uniref:Ribosomal protein S12 methylthiotransferase accessory factor n=1 Tax=Actinokineospora auranticolor TaxID=155976 RepID=A0A2S6GJZ6_9PSEU|nr:YcaO-like family protein [Actinokineospora auranticolor]PPK65547.1 ribosomal protein S12 methylthiotransferase accessory factor [Actinokineospora auranticolor]